MDGSTLAIGNPRHSYKGLISVVVPIISCARVFRRYALFSCKYPQIVLSGRLLLFSGILFGPVRTVRPRTTAQETRQHQQHGATVGRGGRRR